MNLSPLQWGRSFSAAEMGDTMTIARLNEMLQWGRSFSAAEMELFLLVPEEAVGASMGPQLFSCGNQTPPWV